MTTLTSQYAVTAKKMTDEERQEAGAIARAIQNQIHAAIHKGREALWELSEALYDFDETRGWLGLGYENLSQWLAEPEHAMSRTQYYRLVRTWRKLVVERQIDADRLRLLDQSKVALVADKIASAEVLVDEALADAEELGWRDLRDRYVAPTPSAGTPEVKTVPALAQPEPDTAEPVRADEIDEPSPQDDTRALEEEPDVHGEVVLDPAAPSGVVTRNSIEAARTALPEHVLELLSGGRMQAARKEVHVGVGAGASHPRVTRHTLLLFDRLLDLLGADG